MPKYRRGCDAGWEIRCSTGQGDERIFVIYPWTAEGKDRWSHNGARRNACKNAEKCFKEAWRNVDNPNAGVSRGCSGMGFVKGRPGKISLAESIVMEALDLVNPKSGYMTVYVYGRVRGDNGCGGKGLTNMKKVAMGGIHIPDVTNPKRFTILAP